MTGNLQVNAQTVKIKKLSFTDDTIAFDGGNTISNEPITNTIQIHSPAGFTLNNLRVATQNSGVDFKYIRLNQRDGETAGYTILSVDDLSYRTKGQINTEEELTLNPKSGLFVTNDIEFHKPLRIARSAFNIKYKEIYT